MDLQIHDSHKADIFTGLFQHIKLFTEHINMTFNADKMFIQAMDSSHVSVFEIHIPKSWFHVYDLHDDCDLVVGIHSGNLFKVLRARDKNQNLCIQLLEQGDDTLKIAMTCENTEVFDRHFQIPLMEIDSDVMHIPEMEYQAEFAIPSNTFATLIDQLKMFGDTLQIECSEEKIQLCSESQETGKMSVDIPIDDVLSFAIEEDQELNLSFSLSYLHNICMYSKLAKNVEVCMSANYPIRLVYSLSDDDESKFVFYLAPKIDD